MLSAPNSFCTDLAPVFVLCCVWPALASVKLHLQFHGCQAALNWCWPDSSPRAGNVIEEVFTTDERASPIHVTPWGVLGDSWPFFRPNFKAADELRVLHAADEVLPC